MNQVATTKPEIFEIWSDEIIGRIDPFFYHPKFKELTKVLKKTQADPFGNIIATITNGLDYRDFEEDGITDYLRVANIKPYEIDFSDVKKVSLVSSEISKEIQLRKGDILLTRKGTYGIAVALDRDLDAIISSEIFLIRLNRDDIDPKYIEAFLNSSIGQKQFLNQKVGAIMGSLSQDAVKSILIPLPAEAVQREVLSLIQKAYTEKRKKEEEVEKILVSIDSFVLGELGIEISKGGTEKVFEIWSDEIQTRLDPIYLRDYSIFENLKSKYPFVTVSDVISQPPQYGANERSIAGDPDQNIRYIRITDIDENGELRNNDWKTAEHIEDKYFLQQDDLLFARSGATAGKTYLYKDHDGKAIFAGYLIRFKIDPKKVLPDYVFYLTKTRYYALWKNLIQRPAGQPNINSEEFKSFRFPLPPLDAQEKITNAIKLSYSKIRTLRAQATQVLVEAQKQVEQIIFA
ncbi:restriction endonuclease subunit S [Candidatus Peregrinibacteria bacterium]|nr:restriction endonuclease subunit S [Candidatus Peregrinibacteria bacterium]